MAQSTEKLRPVPAVDKAARVLRALAEGGRPMGISELARGLNVSKGSSSLIGARSLLTHGPISNFDFVLQSVL